MPQDITTLTMPRIKIYSPADYPQKEYERFKALLESGKREQVITELRILYPKDSYLANLLANRLGIDLEKELGIIYHYQDIDSTTTAQITQDNTIEITTQYDNFHDTLQTIKNATQYRGNLADTLMAGVSGVFGAIDKGLEKLIKNTGDKRLKIAKYIFQSEGISISATYGYGSNDRDIIKTAVSVGLELAGGYFIGLALEGIIVSLGLASIPAFIVAGAISALIAGILMNTQAGKWVVNEATQFIREVIDSIQSKLHSFFSLFDSNPSKYELVSNPSLESSDYKSLIELLLDSKSNALDIDSLLHTFPNYLAYLTHTTTDTTNSLSLSHSPDSIPMCINALCLNHKNEPLANREIYVYSPNFASFVDKAKSDENGHITFNNACVSSKMTNSDLYFVLNRYGLDEEQKDYHIKISPSKTIQPNDKRARELTDQTLTFNKHIPKAIKANDSIMPNIKVNAIEFIEQNINNSTHIHLKAHYVLRDSQKQYIQGDEHTYTIHSIQKYKHKTKWGYIVFDKDEDIESTLREMTASTPLYKSKRFQELENVRGETVSIPFKEEWQDKQIRFFAYLYKPHKDVGVDVEFEESIPPNVIRIETQDDSGEYIEIEFDENDTLKDINNDDELNDLLHQAKDILYELSPFSSAELAYNNFTAGEYKEALLNAITILPIAKAFKAEKIANKIKNIISKDKRKEDVRIHPNTNKNSNTNAGKKIKSKYATKQEVINVIENKYGLKKEGYKNVYMAKDNKHIKEIWDDIIEGAEVLEDKIDGYGDILKRRKLSDGTIIQLRKKSSGGAKAKKDGKGGTGGSTIEIDASAKKPDQIRIHNKAKENGDW